MRLAIFFTVAVALAGCAPDPLEVSLTQLYRQQSEFDGHDVLTSGVLRTHDKPRHYWIADAADHRVELLSDKDLAPMVGLRLQVQGRFHYSLDNGRRIEAERFSTHTATDPQ